MEILKTELGEESSDTQKFRGVLSTKDELLESLKSWFNHVYKEHIATLLPHFMILQLRSKLAVQRLIAACQKEPALVLKEQDNVTQPCEPQLQTSNYDLLEQPSTTDTSNPHTKRKDSIFMIPLKN